MARALAIFAATPWFQIDANHDIELFGIRLIGVQPDTARKLLLTIIIIGGVILLTRLFASLSEHTFSREHHPKTRFWIHQALQIASAVFVLLALISIWFDDPRRLGSAAGLFSAGLAVALQRVITAVAAYFVILRGRVFNIGDRIVMGGVRGDVIALGFVRTTIMEMGEAPGSEADAPALWVHSRQYTGRIVTVTNDTIFTEPIYNFTREYPYIWEEMEIPIGYNSDRQRAEKILLDVVTDKTRDIYSAGEKNLEELRRMYAITPAEMKPRVYWTLTSNWLSLTVRFLARPHGTRALKDAITRDVIAALDAAKIQIASTTYEIVGLPPLKIENLPKPIQAP